MEPLDLYQKRKPLKRYPLSMMYRLHKEKGVIKPYKGAFKFNQAVRSAYGYIHTCLYLNAQPPIEEDDYDIVYDFSYQYDEVIHARKPKKIYTFGSIHEVCKSFGVKVVR